MSNQNIHIVEAKTHNLKGISVDIPRNQLVVITGVSGSGKSSLAFDTLYAEGQRRYVESLSAYARQFLGRMQKPDVKSIEGIPPAIAISQRTSGRNSRSTVGTSTEIYDYLKLLYARAGHTYSPISGREVKRSTIKDVVNFLEQQPKGSRVYLLAPIRLDSSETLEERLKVWQAEGFSRWFHDGDTLHLSPQSYNQIQNAKGKIDEHSYLLVDRVITDGEKSTSNRFADSVQTAFYEGKGECTLYINEHYTTFTERFEADGISFMESNEHLFDFNSPIGACPTCNGLGNIIGIDPDLVVPDKSKSIYDGAIACWHGEKMNQWNNALIYSADQFGFPIHQPYYALSPEQKQVLWTGNEHFRGLNDFFHEIEAKQYSKIQYRVLLARYRGKALCTDCQGTRLRKEAQYVKIGGRSIVELCQMSIIDLHEWFRHLILSPQEQQIAKNILLEISNRLQYLVDVGLGYLTLNRLSSTLSGGESQRISLAKALGSSLVGSLYVLDEPSIGLHPRDTARLIHVLYQLRDLGNTIVVVEHDEDIIRAADHIIEIGPKAGRHGGEVVYNGPAKQEWAQYDIPNYRRKWNHYIEINGVCENNLKNINVRVPLNVMTVITGVSGSGKSSLIGKVLYPALKRHFGGTVERIGNYSQLGGNLKMVHDIEYVDQNPLSRSSRSNPVTYLKAYDEIRRLYAEQPLAKQLGFTPAHFSFNTPGGRCEQCQGEGTITIEMQFMADIQMECESCHGKRFKQDILDVHYRGKSIYDVLCMTVNQAIDFFGENKEGEKIVQRLTPLQDVGIGYIQLGQSSSTLSGGESQRVKLASFLAQENSQPTIFVFDEPTTGLSHKDIGVLLSAFNQLISRGHTIWIIEHNPSIIVAADHIIDLGPEGGEGGGEVVFEGTPEELAQNNQSHTGRYIQHLLVSPSNA